MTELTHKPEKCIKCGVKIIPLQHPHEEWTYVSRSTLYRMGPQWTCGCATWGPADGSEFNPFELDIVP